MTFSAAPLRSSFLTGERLPQAGVFVHFDLNDLDAASLAPSSGEGLRILTSIRIAGDALSDNGATLHGVKAVTDKDACGLLLSRELDVECLVVATDVAALSLDWGTPRQREIRRISPQGLTLHRFATGSQGPRVWAGSAVVLAAGARAVLGSLEHIDATPAGQFGTQIRIDDSDD